VFSSQILTGMTASRYFLAPTCAQEQICFKTVAAEKQVSRYRDKFYMCTAEGQKAER